MKKKGTALVISAGLLLAACGGGQPKDTLAQKKETLDSLKKVQQKINDDIARLQDDIAKLDTTATTQKSALVSVDTLIAGNFTHYIDLQGKVEAVNISYVTPRNGGGQVKALYITKGQEVHKGQLLLKLDDVLQQQSLKAAQQQVASAQALADNYADVYRRRKNLFDQGIGTEVQLNADKTAMDNSQSQLKQAQAQLKSAQEQLDFTNVYSDVNGVAEDVNVRVGEIFTASAPTPQIKIVNTTDLKVTAQVPENYLTKVNVGDNVVINFPDINKTITAKISIAGKVIDPNSRSFYIEVHLPADKDLRPNQIANVKIQDYTAANALSVPVNTLQTDDKGKFVYAAVNTNGKLVAKKKPITIGQAYGDKVQVLSGLEAGDNIITEGFQGLYDGQPLTIGR
ncbi:MAG TPA: efflux RND transporter periplasmic adaptor subunit [Chitinophagaceae bacterium]|nr:efflux RND transporter periplasmic adaptor subunit [Chitinophagaceae bacterium]